MHPTFQLSAIDDAKATEWLPQFKPEMWPTMAPFTAAIDAKSKQVYLPVPPGFGRHKLLKFPTEGKAVSVAITPTGRLAVITTAPNKILIAQWNKQGSRLLPVAEMTLGAPANHVEFLSHSKLVIAYPGKPLAAYRIRGDVLVHVNDVTQRLTRYGRLETVQDIGRNTEGNFIILTNKHITTHNSDGYLVRRFPINIPLIQFSTDEENHMWLLEKDGKTVHHWSSSGQRIKKYDSSLSKGMKINEIVVHKKFMGICTNSAIFVKLIQKPLKDLLKKPPEQTLADKRKAFIELQQTYNTADEAAKRSQKELMDTTRDDEKTYLPPKSYLESGQ